MYTTFNEDRPYIEEEYINENDWDETSGIHPEEIKKLIYRFDEENRETMAPALLVANAYRILIENCQLGINEHQMFPDKIRHGGKYDPTATWCVTEQYCRDRFAKTYEKRCPAAWHQRSVFEQTALSVPDTDVWHTVIDWREAIRLGAIGMYKRALEEKANKEKEGVLTKEQSDFYDSVAMAYETMLKYIGRLKDGARKKGLNRYADAMANLEKSAPKTLYEVLAFSHIMVNMEELGIELCRSLGSIDELYMPFYLKDLEDGIETEESVKEMFKYFFIKWSAERRRACQPFSIGKTLNKAGSREEKFIMLILNAYDEIGVVNPKIHVRFKKNPSDKMLTKICEMIRGGNSSMVMLNDETVFKGYERIGISRELADDYVLIGCYEPAVMGLEDARICAAWFNLSKAVEYTISGGKDYMQNILLSIPTKKPATWEDFMAQYYAYLDAQLEATINCIDEMTKYVYEANPSPFLSGTIENCMKTGKDIFNNGALIRNQSVKCFAIATTVDSLLAVKKFVYEKRKLTIDELSEALAHNWEGYEEIRSEIMFDPVKFGNNINEADSLAREIYDFCGKKIINRPTTTGGVYRMGCDSVNMAEDYGVRCSASADGRRAGEILSKNLRPVNGMEKRGVTSLVQSICSLDNTLFVDGAPLDFVVHPSAVEGVAGLEAMKTIFKIFFENGGFCIQGNVVSLEQLYAAKKNPEKYKNLQVRVCGWNEYFVNMAPIVQDDYIKRLEGVQA